MFLPAAICTNKLNEPPISSYAGCFITGRRYVDGDLRSHRNVYIEKALQRDDETTSNNK